MRRQLKQGKGKGIYCMNKKEYIKDKISTIVTGLITYIIILLILLAFKVNIQATISISIVYIVGISIILIVEYLKKKSFYEDFTKKLTNLDQKYLIVEMLNDPTFLDAKILTNSLYEIDKSMIEKINEYKTQTQSFKEYVELWIHEVKLPVSSLTLMVHNSKTEQNKKLLEQLSRLDNYLEQILYYVRSENAEKDYLITQVNLAKVISNTALKNKDVLLENGIDFIVSDVNIDVLTDSKWLEFILNQIIDNSIKYSKNKNAFIKIVAKEKHDRVDLAIYDNGIGIKEENLPRVFDKTYTGSNGRTGKNSTGMGLYIVKKLCEKLGHQVTIKSKEKEFTCVKISFFKNDYYNVTEKEVKKKS